MVIKNPKYYIFTNDKGERLVGVNNYIKKLKVEEDWDALCEKTAKKRGIDPKVLRAEWDAKADKSKARGIKYHKMMEDKYRNMNRPDVIIENPDLLKWSDCKLMDNTAYIEKLIWDENSNAFGFADFIQVKNKVINIIDYKSNEEIKYDSFNDKRYLEPLEHIKDCNWFDYSLQLNFYMYICLINNPDFKMGSMIIEHIIFDWDDNVKEVIKLKVPDFQKEIKQIIEYVSTRHN
jgi:hypothetical protein